MYRIYSEADERLLYIGITIDLNSRMNQHRKDKIKGQWYKVAGRISVELYPTRAAACIAEFRAIHAERPAHNTSDEKRFASFVGPLPAPLKRQEYGAGRWRW
ncbi:GIY-YIG nuclease family protein [Paenarthrobacter nicotinovorans]|uniref:GIY-YIG nuclease family protein n=1 Tax=Paenarthrobacter nicotinovorans TaxID=29320 RepID=UPI00382B6494